MVMSSTILLSTMRTYPMPAKPKDCEEGILKGLYKLRDAPAAMAPLFA